MDRAGEVDPAGQFAHGWFGDARARRTANSTKALKLERGSPLFAVETYTVAIDVPGDVKGEHAGETVTVDVREADLWLEADCQQGWCTRCAARLLEDEVDHADARRYYAVDEEADLVLTCRARPRSDLRLRAFEYDEILEHRAAHELPPGRSK